MRYIETVAIDWADRGIDTAEKADEHIRLYNTDFRKIMRAFGQSYRDPNKNEEKFMEKWLKEYKFPVDIVVVACEKTISKIGQPVFNYADTILKGWREKGIMTKDDILADDTKFAEARKEEALPKPDKKSEDSKTQKVRNKFSDYEQRVYDYDYFEKMERQKGGQ